MNYRTTTQRQLSLVTKLKHTYGRNQCTQGSGTEEFFKLILLIIKVRNALFFIFHWFILKVTNQQRKPRITCKNCKNKHSYKKKLPTIFFKGFGGWGHHRAAPLMTFTAFRPIIINAIILDALRYSPVIVQTTTTSRDTAQDTGSILIVTRTLDLDQP